MLMRFSSPLAASDVIVFRQRVIKTSNTRFLIILHFSFIELLSGLTRLFVFCNYSSILKTS